ncbi:transporter substrate-binding domain-containing protein [uncultured Gilvimarinus sp.]|uniref:substrate-binding periplasmic protein n=1 Tax=uncultured Gilvimarinus sp. TaxID=1689143 RepID=UPI0030EE7313|tara:strand:+ start:1328 stop:2128 length:801 start_codon:yes stop_codon:yes gene_type:complete
MRLLRQCRALGPWGVSLALLLASQARAQLPDTLHLAATDWCPYTCVDQPDRPGIVAEYVRTVLAREQIDLTLTFLPWTRAVVEAQRGAVDGLLTAVVDEAPQLMFTQEPVAEYQDCLYTRSDSSWEYDGVASLSEQRLGVVHGYGYSSQLNRYIARAPENNVIALRGVNSTARLWDMLLLKRFDVFIQERRVVAWQAYSHQRDITAIRPASCLASQPFYLALYPGNDYSRELINRLDRAFAAAENRELWLALQARYLSQAEAAAPK